MRRYKRSLITLLMTPLVASLGSGGKVDKAKARSFLFAGRCLMNVGAWMLGPKEAERVCERADVESLALIEMAMGEQASTPVPPVRIEQ